MKIELNLVNDAVHMQASGASSEVKVNIDGPPDMGGEALGSRPMELVLMALASCSALDMLSILRKQRQTITRFNMEAEGQRRTEIPNIFTHIELRFNMEGDIDQQKAEKAAELAVKKYCSVHDMLAAGGVDITYKVNIKP